MASISGKDQHQLDSALPGTARETRKGIIFFQKLTVALEPKLKLPILPSLGRTAFISFYLLSL